MRRVNTRRTGCGGLVRGLTLLSACLAVLAACRGRSGGVDAGAGPGPIPAASASFALAKPAPPPHHEAGRWTSPAEQGGAPWCAVVVAKGTSHADLVRLAHHLHAREPTVFFDLYDDDAELPRLVAAHGNDDALPAAWREAHAVGTVTGVLGPGTATQWQLLEWKTLDSTPL